jgi:hypothetical protein
MKLLISISMLIMSFSSFALENGNYTNKDYEKEEAQMYKSLALDNSTCDNGGAVVKFYGADAKNFCVGTETRDVFKYKKCVGKEVSEYPVKFCIGVKRTVEMVTEKKVTQNAAGEIVLNEVNLDDGKIYFQQSYTLKETENGDVIVKVQFKDFRDKDGRHGEAEFLFQKD